LAVLIALCADPTILIPLDPPPKPASPDEAEFAGKAKPWGKCGSRPKARSVRDSIAADSRPPGLASLAGVTRNCKMKQSASNVAEATGPPRRGGRATRPISMAPALRLSSADQRRTFCLAFSERLRYIGESFR